MPEALMKNFLKDWIPYKLSIEDKKVLFHWLYLAEQQFKKPFFYETIVSCKRHPFNSKPVLPACTLEEVEEFAKTAASLPPIAFIFHISRCGSTLLSQLLSMEDSHVVLAEVPLIDELLRLPYKTNFLSAAQTEKALRTVISLLGKKRTGKESRLFIKLDSWHLMFYKVIRKLYPDTPFILLYRSPGEVIRSHQRQRGMHTVPGLIEPEIFGWEHSAIHNDTPDNYMVSILERYFAALLEIAEKDKRTLLLNYSQGAMELVSRVADFTGITFSKAVMEEMKKRSLYHAKHPQQIFEEKHSQNSFPFSLSSLLDLYKCTEEKRKLQVNHALHF